VTTVTAHYENLAANSYANLNANVSGVEGLSDYNFFKVTLKNNGSSLAKVRIDTKSGSTHIHTNVVSIGDWGAWTEAEGTIVQLGAGTTATIGITFDQASGDKPLDTIFFFIDSATHDDSSLKTGEVVISDYEFSTVYDWSKATSVDATFNSDSSMYEISKTAGVTTIAYTNAAGYANASSCVNWVEGTHNSVQLRIRNTGSSNASIRIDLIDEDWGTPITAQANVFERPDIVTNANNETTVTLGSQQMMDVTINYTGNLQFIVLYVNSMQGAPAENSGSVAIEVVKLGNIA